MSTDIVRTGVVILAHTIKKELVGKDRQKLRHRKVWVKSWIERRDNYGVSSSFLKELKEEDPFVYLNILRLNCTHFDGLLEMVHGMPIPTR